MTEAAKVTHRWTFQVVERGRIRGWVTKCSCGWESVWHESKLVAEDDAIEHTYREARGT